MSQRNRAMQRVFPTPSDSLIVICYRFRKVKAVIAPLWHNTTVFQDGYQHGDVYLRVMLNEAKTPRPRPELRGRGRGQFLEVEAKAEAKNNYEKNLNND